MRTRYAKPGSSPGLTVISAEGPIPEFPVQVISYDKDQLTDAEVSLADLPPPDLAPDLRLLLIASAREQGRADDSRIFDQTQRPGRLGPIYGMIQRALEQFQRGDDARDATADHQVLRTVDSIGGLLGVHRGSSRQECPNGTSPRRRRQVGSA